MKKSATTERNLENKRPIGQIVENYFMISKQDEKSELHLRIFYPRYALKKIFFFPLSKAIQAMFRI